MNGRSATATRFMLLMPMVPASVFNDFQIPLQTTFLFANGFNLMSFLIPIILVLAGFFGGMVFERFKRKQKDISDQIKPEPSVEPEEEPEEEILSSEEELRMLNATKDKFFSIIAHDLKNPFNSLLGFSDLLKNDFDSYKKDDIKRFIGIIHESSKHGFDLLENLLQWSRSQTGRIAFIPDQVNIADLIDGCIDLLKTTADKKEIRMYKDIPHDITVYGDLEMLSTVFRNLISNAIKFTLRGGRIKIKAKQNTRSVTISVIDTGVGIPEEKIPDLFRIDKQVSTYGTGNEKGTGLGLILCKEFIDKHKGKIKVSSERKNGSEFKVILPLQIKKQDGNAGRYPKTKSFEKGEFAAHH
ncbi:MAG: HAMP domain-containing histidine kinase [Bacteroidales bacterium]|nr:HAMP domain-containing histidine kinase [Bacteroidales bacterium]